MPHVMVSGGESRPNRFDFKDWIERGAYDIVQPDCNVTGITEAWNIARMSHLWKKYCCPHDWHGGLTIMANAALACLPEGHLAASRVSASNKGHAGSYSLPQSPIASPVPGVFSQGGNSFTRATKIAKGRSISAMAGSSPSRVANCTL